MKKILNKETVLYLIFGALTTGLNFFVYYGLTRWGYIDKNIANGFAILLSIMFAFATNEKYVFTDNQIPGLGNYIKLFITFFMVRLLSMGLDMLTFFLLATFIGLNDIAVKLFIAAIIVVFNYMMSKLFVFKK